MAAEGDLAETSKNQTVDSLPVPVPPKRKRKMKNTEEGDKMLEKAFTILTSAAAAATADDECRSFGSFISNKLRNYLPCTRNKVQHEICNIIFAADQGHFDAAYPVPVLSPASQVSSFAGSDDIRLSDLMCI